jgi:hypothetical protein
MVYRVKIKDIQPAFDNAHKKLWEIKNPPKPLALFIRDPFTGSRIQAEWWEEVYGVTIRMEDGKRWDAWTHAEFPSEEYLTWFIIKWS